MHCALLVNAAVREFQSAPGREAGRCHVAIDLDKLHDCFNPRPAVRPGDALPPASLLTGYIEFQSAPGREAGRCLGPCLWQAR